MRTRFLGAVAVGAIAVVAVVLLLWRVPVEHWLGIHTGTLNEPGGYYGFWSGFGSDIGEVALIGGLITIYRRHNCEVHGCWLLGRHQTAAGHRVCRRHHPDDHLTAGDVAEQHEDALAPAPVSLDAKFDRLTESIGDLAEVIRIRMAADRPASGGAGSNPASEGLEADGPVVPPPAATRKKRA